MNGTGRTAYQGWVFRLIIINIVVFVLQVFTASVNVMYSPAGLGEHVPIPAMTYYFGLTPALVAGKGFVWQVFTYMFLHSDISLAHIFFNMYALFIFGIPIEQVWGGRKFLAYYAFTGVGAGITIFAINIISQGIGFYIPTIGASGAVFGILLAFGVLYPNAEILLFFFLPIKAKYLVLLYGLLELYLEVFGGQSNISHLGHLGGLFFGVLYFYVFNRSSITFKSKLFTAKLGRKTGEYTDALKSGKIKPDDSKRQLRIAIIRKLRETGFDSLTDDEVQYIRYLSIMHENAEITCGRERFSMEDEECRDCAKDEACFLAEVKKHIKN